MCYKVRLYHTRLEYAKILKETNKSNSSTTNGI